ncbi:MAG: cobalamin biosynthesis protein CobC [Zetaproteobacteria bacterium CG12_big_fil_rev_8_21_14_0_65_55_1124]|nr:MAG: hypothetical protein AUJ58_03485 [Zetaproteobacteria bacterium CG1_02_55_237]PIS19533.1 MAG: cobalamin biosynthesis protein CobC [Zetaproteobacteria bacterium CG08_land_8_20_14_0_20_55_17]PIW42366.1 MAG: cobalamin biosynthesis protein CobC [Zetaproteobacteria bacterium CG12_big_fil_rev_8_21_14_0_65_55_1124]PIY52833.1 MAG: cobalamin biosynthesis protein CobC [Zetaproteobacteria bacterium CG_4_10_14_0_8_um_filter_55_43]PIZ38039.1 MAG: cobalamin biosynthesis protein CobC [Zetaproteobacteri
MTETTIDLLRHGALVGGVRYRGNIEAELTAAGRADMDAVWAQLNTQVGLIVSSPLGRCRKPAEEWSNQSGIACEIVDDFREMHYGEWEGLGADEIEQRFPGQLACWRENPVGMQIPGAESIEDFAARVVRAWGGMLRAHAGHHLLVVAHSGTLRVILAHVLGAGLPSTRRFAMPYAAWSRVHVSHDRCLLTELNRKP